MICLRRSSLAICILVTPLFGCVTSSKYQTQKPNSLGTDIEVTPDRVIVECEFITDYEGDYKEPYGFMIHILDNQKTVLTVSNGTVLEKRDCFEKLKVSEKIIKDANIVFVRGRGDAEAPVKLESLTYSFPKHGTFNNNGRSLNFLGIWNDRGQCYSAFNGSGDFCSSSGK